jgi:template-activating factor I
MASKPQPPSKRQKTEAKSQKDDDAKLEGYFAELDKVQTKIDNIDKDLENELLAVQKKWEIKKKPLMKERAEVLKKIPQFWKTAVSPIDIIVTLQYNVHSNSFIF